MNKYLLKMFPRTEALSIKPEDIEAYKNAVISEMNKRGASDAQIRLVKDGAIKYAIKTKRKPEDLAWAIMQ